MREANRLSQLGLDYWAVVARQPFDLMRWEWQVPAHEIKNSVAAGRIVTRQRKVDEDGCYQLEAKWVSP